MSSRSKQARRFGNQQRGWKIASLNVIKYSKLTQSSLLLKGINGSLHFKFTQLLFANGIAWSLELVTKHCFDYSSQHLNILFIWLLQSIYWSQTWLLVIAIDASTYSQLTCGLYFFNPYGLVISFFLQNKSLPLVLFATLNIP